MRMGRRQHERPQRRQIQPKRQFAADDTAILPAPTPRNDFHAPDAVGAGAVQESLQRMERGLGGFAV